MEGGPMEILLTKARTTATIIPLDREENFGSLGVITMCIGVYTANSSRSEKHWDLRWSFGLALSWQLMIICAGSG